MQSSHEWVGQAIHWEICNRLNYNHTDKWYMHKARYIQENKVHKFAVVFTYELITQLYVI